MKPKLKEWLWRYGIAEIFGTLTAMIGAVLALRISENYIVAAYVGTLSENFGYYSTIFVRDLLASIRHHRENTGNSKVLSVFKLLRNWIVEFGGSEILDTLLIRPLCMFLFPKAIGSFEAGILVGKLVADMVFYIPTILGYEFRKQRWG